MAEATGFLCGLRLHSDHVVLGSQPTLIAKSGSMRSESELVMNLITARIDGGQGNSRYFRCRVSDADQIPTDEHRRSESDLGP